MFLWERLQNSTSSDGCILSQQVVVHKPVLKPRRSSDSNDADPRARRVRKQFEEIDAGRLDPDKVFSTISGESGKFDL